MLGITDTVCRVVAETLKVTKDVELGFGLDDPDIVAITDTLCTVVTDTLKLTEGVEVGFGLADDDKTEAGEGVVV